MLLSPLEQFEVKILGVLAFFGLFDISFTVVSFSLILVGLISFGFIFFSSYKSKIVPSSWQSCGELVYGFVLEMIYQQAGRAAQVYFPIILTTFIFILFSNLIGLIPYSFTVTAQLVITFTLAFAFNIGFLLMGLIKNGLKFFNLFVPSGAPVVLMFLIIPIEMLSYTIRTFSLSLRLFANMMAGHTLLHILASFIVMFGQAGFLVLGIFPFLLVLAITALEFGIAFLQAYVFTILLCIYLNDALHPGH